MDLDFSFLENKHEAQAFMYSAGVIVLSVIAVVAFIVSGGGILFYVFAVLAVALGLYMAYHISKTPVQAAAAPARRKQAKR
jgi:flagellar basal body-associated protein FliL